MKMIRWIICVLLMLALATCVYAREVEAQQDIIDACTYGQNADMSSYQMTKTELEEMFHRLYERGMLPWYTTESYRYRYEEGTGIVQTFEPDSLPLKQYDRTVYEQGITVAMDACIREGMSELQIALAVHDYLILNCAYDESLRFRTGYDLLNRGSTVCSGYTALYMDILRRAGVSCISVSSEEMNHTWNLVRIDGSWYHVDVTWDDPTPDRYGFVSHEYFLLTDEQISGGEEPHYGWKTDVTCTGTLPVEPYWKDVESGIFFESSQVSYLIHSTDFTNTICRRDETTGEETVLHTVKDQSINIGHGAYMYVHRGLALREGRLWYSMLDGIYAMNTDGTDRKMEQRYRESGKFLQGFHLNGDTAYMTLADHDGNPTGQTEQLPASDVHIHSFTETKIPATCTEGGHTLSVCHCGLQCQSEPALATGHKLSVAEQQDPTLFAPGYQKEVCAACDYTNVTDQPQLTFLQWILGLLGLEAR